MQRLISSFGLITVACVLMTTTCVTPTQAQVKNDSLDTQSITIGKKIKQWNKSILDAGKQYKKDQFQQSAALIKEVQTELMSAASSADKKTLRALRTIHKKLTKAHHLLKGKDVSLEDLPPLPTQPTSKPNPPQPTQKVSFVNDVAPIVNRKCGNCHVNRSFGGFSAATFTALNQSGTIDVQSPMQSRLVEIIESGEMPKGNLKVTPDELNTLKAWVAQGATFDGANPNANLRTLRPKQSVLKPEEMAMTGKETVSFGQHVAPMLLKNCAQCHLARNPRANFSVASLRSILRGGNSGAVIQPGDRDSTILLRLLGKDRAVMPPSGKLEDETIELVAKWIEEGARFDPQDIDLPLQTVADKGIAATLDHEKLSQSRQLRAQQTWRLAYTDLEPQQATTENFFVLGTGGQERLSEVGAVAENLAKRVTSVLKSTGNAPFVRGNINLFVIDKRYDFSEFGKMIEKRQYPKSALSSWKADLLETYCVLLLPFSADPNEYELPLARNLTAIHVSAWNSTIPDWFADGMAWATVAKMFKRNGTISKLETNARAAFASMKRSDDLLTGKLSADVAALCGYQFVSTLQTDRRSFKELTKKLKAQNNFDQAFRSSYGITPKEFFQRASNGKRW